MSFVKSSRGRDTGVKARVLAVEEQACEGGGLHVLAWARGVVQCRGCGETWAALDGAINQRRGWLE